MHDAPERDATFQSWHEGCGFGVVPHGVVGHGRGEDGEELILLADHAHTLVVL